MNSDLARGLEPTTEELVADLIGIPVEQVTPQQTWDYLMEEAEIGARSTWPRFGYRAPLLPHIALASAAIGGYGIATGLDEEYPRPLPTLLTDGSGGNG